MESFTDDQHLGFAKSLATSQQQPKSLYLTFSFCAKQINKSRLFNDQQIGH